MPEYDYIIVGSGIAGLYTALQAREYGSVLIVTKGSMGTGIFTTLLMFNPVDVYRILNFISIGEFQVMIGLTSVDFPEYIGVSMLWGICLIWIIAPLGISYYYFKNRYLE